MTDNVTELRPGLAAAFTVPERPGVRLAPGRRLDVEQAREFLAFLAGRLEAGSGPQVTAYLMGRLDGHARTLLDIIDAITEPGR